MSINAEKLQTEMEQLSSPPADSHPPLWEYWRYQLWKHVTQGDDPYGFMGWPPVYHTMLVNHWPSQMEWEYSHMANDPYWASLLPAANDWGLEFYPQDTMPDTSLSRNLVHQMYHLFLLHKYTGVHVSDLEEIVEVGGGYGAMAYICSRLGFHGNYTIFDEPEFSLLQRFFIGETCSEDTFKSFSTRKRIPGWSADLLIACYSISEIALPKRDRYLDRLSADSYLLLYSDRFEDYDNVEYFNKFMDKNPDFRWSVLEADHLPPRSLYALGKRNELAS